MENKILTAEELQVKMIQAIQYQSIFGINEEKNNRIAENCTSLAIEFAKLHVQAALKSASEKAGVNWEGAGNSLDAYVNPETILEAYPLNNIK